MHLAQGRALSTYKGIARALLLCAERPLRGDGQAQESQLGSRCRLGGGLREEDSREQEAWGLSPFPQVADVQPRLTPHSQQAAVGVTTEPGTVQGGVGEGSSPLASMIRKSFTEKKVCGGLYDSSF